MIGAILGVIFGDKNGHPGPELGAGECLHNSAKGEVIVRHVCDGRRLARTGAAGVVVGKPEDLEPGHVIFPLKPLQLRDETIGAGGIGDVHVEGGEVFIHVSLQRGHGGFVKLGLLVVGSPFAVAPVADPRFCGTIPDVAAVGTRRVIESALARIGKLAPRVFPVTLRPVAFHPVAGIGRHAPFVAVRTDLAFHVEIVEEHELFREGVVVGRDFFGKEAE